MKPVGWFLFSMIALVVTVVIFDIRKEKKDGYK